MNTNYIKYLKSFILSPIFPLLLGLTIFIVYTIYFTPYILCDGQDILIDLKDKLDYEIWQLEEEHKKLERTRFSLKNLDELTCKYTNGGVIHRKVWSSGIIKLENNKNILWSNINSLENQIKELEPNYTSKLNAAWQLKWGIIPKGK